MDTTHHTILHSIKYNTNDKIFLQYYLEFPSLLTEPIQSYIPINNKMVEFLKKRKLTSILDMCLYYKDLKKIEYMFKICNTNPPYIKKLRDYFWNHDEDYFKTYIRYLLHGSVSSLMFKEIKRFIIETNFTVYSDSFFYQIHTYSENTRNFGEVIINIIDYNYSQHISILLHTIAETRDENKIRTIFLYLLQSKCSKNYLHIFMVILNKLHSNRHASLLHELMTPDYAAMLVSSISKQVLLQTSDLITDYIDINKKKYNISEKILEICKYLFYEYDEQDVFDDFICNSYDEVFAYIVSLPNATTLLQYLFPRYLDYLIHYQIQAFNANQYNPYLDSARYGSFTNFMTLWNVSHELREDFLVEKVYFVDTITMELNLFTISFYNKDTRICKFLKEQSQMKHLLKPKYLMDAFRISVMSFFKNCLHWNSMKRAIDVLKQKIRCILSCNSNSVISLYQCMLEFSHGLIEYDKLFSLKSNADKHKLCKNRFCDIMIWFVKEWSRYYSVQTPIEELLQIQELDFGITSSYIYFLSDIVETVPFFLKRMHKELLVILKKVPLENIIIRVTIQKLLLLFHFLDKNTATDFMNTLSVDDNNVMSWKWIGMMELINHEPSNILMNALIVTFRQNKIQREQIMSMFECYFSNIRDHISNDIFVDMKVNMLKKTFSVLNFEIADCLIRFGVPILQHFVLSKNRLGFRIFKKWFPVYSLMQRTIKRRRKLTIYNKHKTICSELQSYFFMKTLECNSKKEHLELGLKENVIRNCFPEHISKERFVNELLSDSMYCSIKADGERCFLNITKGVYPSLEKRKHVALFKNIAAECEKIYIKKQIIYFVYDFWDITKNKRIPFQSTLILLGILNRNQNFFEFMDEISSIKTNSKLIYPKPIYCVPKGKEGYNTIYNLYSCMELQKPYPYDGLILITKDEKRWKFKPQEHMTIDVAVDWDSQICYTKEKIPVNNICIEWSKTKVKKYSMGVYRLYWKKCGSLCGWTMGEYRPEKHAANPSNIVKQLELYHKNPFFLDDCKPYFETPYYHKTLHATMHLHHKQKNKLNLLFEKCNLKSIVKNASVLDIGCGSSLCDVLWKNNAFLNYTGIDSDYGIIQSMNKYKTQFDKECNIQLIWTHQKSINDYLNENKNSQTIVLCIDALQHIVMNYSYGETITFLEKIYNAITENGYCVLRILNNKLLDSVLSITNNECFIENECFIKKIKSTKNNNPLRTCFIKYYFSWVHCTPITEILFDCDELKKIMASIGFNCICEYNGSLGRTTLCKDIMESYTTFVFKK